MNLPQLEQKILGFWKRNQIFQKTLKKTQNKKKFIFFEGPPTVNGRPGIHHVENWVFKDVIPRYKTMNGFFVDRKAGWDTHGLPVEIEVEKQLGLKNKKEIEEYGIDKFNKKCKESVRSYLSEWEKITERMGYWIDLKKPYITYENDYIETLWWIIQQAWQKGLLYKGYSVAPYCPRCGTSLSSHEVAQGYQNVKENSVYIKLAIEGEKDTFFLVWTTTPWTLPANVALAVGKNIDYVKVKTGKEKYILAKQRLNVLTEPYKIEKEFKGKDLINKKYKPIFNLKSQISNLKNETQKLNIYKVITGDFVSMEDGTGIVHIAPAFGIDDMAVSKINNLPILLTVDEEGKFKKEVHQWQGEFVKDADPKIIIDLKNKGHLYKEEICEHEYPFCWRCKTPLLYYAITSWFIKMTALKKQLLNNNEKINWVPDYLKRGRFGGWLREVKDWNLSRKRYWATPLPIWECEKCNEIKVIGSVKELGKKLKDLHRPYVDEVFFKCPKCKSKMKRVPEVADCWFDSGSMPYAQWHYPFENKKKIDKGEAFPADFISEAIDQTRGWFYTLLAVSTFLGKGPAYKNVISLGHILDAKSQKMSKSRGNVVQPVDVINEYGADATRWYMYTVNQAGESKMFDIKDVKERYNRFFGTLFNIYVFFKTYTDKKFQPQNNFKSQNVLDKWIISLLASTNQNVISNLEKYDIVSAARSLEKFVEELSNWYVRRSRPRFQKPESIQEKNEANQTLYYVLMNFSKMAAPFIPFITEEIYLNLKKANMPESIHLCDYPKLDKKMIDNNLMSMMDEARNVVSFGLEARAKASFKVRQPLASLKIKNQKSKIKNNKSLLGLIKDEVNVKQIIFDGKIKEDVELDFKITPELKTEGQFRELCRAIQDLRKKAGLKPQDKIILWFEGSDEIMNIVEKFKNEIKKIVGAKKIEFGKIDKFDAELDVKIDDLSFWIRIKKTK